MSTQETNLKAIADAIRAKEGSADPIPANTFAERISAIETGIKLPVLTNPGAAGDLRTGKQLINANGEVLTGSMPDATQATPSISVNSSGLITASATQGAGFVSAGTKSANKQLTTQGGTTITPGTYQKTAVGAGRYTTGNVYVAGDADLVAANIKKGVNIFGVTGSFAGGAQIHQAKTRFRGNTATTISPGFTPKVIFGLWTSDLDTDTEGVGCIAFWGTSASNTMTWHRALFDYSTLGYAITTYETQADTFTWNGTSVTVKYSWVNGTYDVFVIG